MAERHLRYVCVCVQPCTGQWTTSHFAGPAVHKLSPPDTTTLRTLGNFLPFFHNQFACVVQVFVMILILMKVSSRERIQQLCFILRCHASLEKLLLIQYIVLRHINLRVTHNTLQARITTVRLNFSFSIAIWRVLACGNVSWLCSAWTFSALR